MALPPRLPCTTRCSSAAGWRASSAFDSAAPMKPTGTPITAAGRSAPASTSSSRRKSAVGRVADDDDRARELGPPELQSGRGAGRAELCGKADDVRVRERADHLVVRRETRPRDAGGDLGRIAEDWLAGLQRALRSRAEARRGGHVIDQVDHAAGVDHAHDHGCERRVEPVEPGLAADHRERAAVDLGSVAHVAGHVRTPRAATLSATLAAARSGARSPTSARPATFRRAAPRGALRPRARRAAPWSRPRFPSRPRVRPSPSRAT